MKPAPDNRPFTRRDLLRFAGAAAFASSLPGSLVARNGGFGPPAGDRRLVLLFFEGGNDGLNTVIPFADDRYHKARPKLALKGNLVKLDEVTALHPAMSPWRKLFDQGRLTVLRDVGYTNPNRSHFVSRDIWHSGHREVPDNPTGWVGRALEDGGEDRFPAVAVGVSEAPLILRGPYRSGLTLQDLAHYQLRGTRGAEGDKGLAGLEAGARQPGPGLAGRLARLAGDSYRMAGNLHAMVEKVAPGKGYPDTALASELRLMARLIRAKQGPPVLWARLGGFDTHALQQGTQTALLGQAAAATAAFLNDLARDGSDGRTLMLIYSEFGRRVAENGSAGTDHGTAGPVFALGGRVKGGLLGHPSNLEDLQDGDLKHQFDFRGVFGEAARDWMGWKKNGLFDQGFSSPGFLA